MPELNTVTDPNLPEPKGVSTATDGEVYQADGAGSGDWGKLVTEGWVIIDNTGSAQALTASTWLLLTNNGLGTETDVSFVPPGMANPWDSVTNTIDLAGAGFAVGDQFRIRFDVSFTTSGANHEVALQVILGYGSGSPITLPVQSTNVKTASTARMNRYIGYTIRDASVLNYPMRIEAWTDGTGNTVVLNELMIEMVPRHAKVE